ncbi:cobalt-precorrin 5A hydrolase [Neisseria sp. Ec49-e6-T10]|uniref:cobalt-precorrin 5A hydrolase n=1 Tax=Neisseria sp. Ec49-e6-T10 TaxID=3140744 RepID=UPI003EBEAA64
MNTEQPKHLAVLTVTPGAKAQAIRLAQVMQCDCYTSDKLLSEGFLPFDGSMADCVKRLFGQYQALLFICATGITVRMIAPLVVDKLADPAILVMDEQAKHVISLLSGHVGGANRLAEEIAHKLNATAVITTATDVNQVAALDTLAVAVGADVTQYRAQIKDINQMLVSGKKVGLYLDQIEVKDKRGFIEVHDLENCAQLDALVVVSYHRLSIQSQCPVVKIVPRQIVVGIGCRRDTDSELIEQTLLKHLEVNNIDPKAISAIGSVVIKADEKGLIQLAKRYGVPFHVFEIEALKEHEHRFEASEFVRKTIGVGSVSQPAAWLMSNGHLIGHTLKQDGITITLGVNSCYTS